MFEIDLVETCNDSSDTSAGSIQPETLTPFTHRYILKILLAKRDVASIQCR
jgi:hypothetical protein